MAKVVKARERLELKKRSTAPRTPSSDTIVLYIDSDGNLAKKDSTGATEVVGAQEEGAGGPLIAYTTVDESKADNNTVAANAELSLAVEANSTYLCTVWTVMTADASGAFKYAVGSDMASVLRDKSSDSNNTIDISNSFSSPTNVNGAAAQSFAIFIIRVGANAGNIKLGWAQQNAFATPTILKAGSWMRLEKMLPA